MSKNYFKKLSWKQKNWDKNQTKMRKLLTQFILASMVVTRVFMPGLATAAEIRDT